MAMWQSEMTNVLRTMLLDFNTPPTYTDQRLQMLICVAAQLVINELVFNTLYVPDNDALTITPDPCDRINGTRDDSFINLVCMRGACVIERGEVRKAAGQAIAIRDGSSSVDLRSSMAGRLKLLEVNWCKEFADASFTYRTSQIQQVGAAIMSPFRIFAGYSDVGYYPSEGDRGSFFH